VIDTLRIKCRGFPTLLIYTKTSKYITIDSIFTLKMEATGSPKTLVSYNITAEWHNPEDHNFNFHCHENLKYCMRYISVLSFTHFSLNDIFQNYRKIWRSHDSSED
jgi:hypothetical protein